MIPEPPAQVHLEAQPAASRIVEAVLATARGDGAIPDTPDGEFVNADTNFLYLLTGLAAQARRDPSLWNVVEQGLRWLAKRQWGAGDPLPGAFPDGLPLEGPGIPMGDPPVAAVGATAARFVALVSLLPQPPQDLVESARLAWAGLQTWNWVEGKGLQNAWYCDPEGSWKPRGVWYAADQADYEAGLKGAAFLGFFPRPAVPWRRYSPTRLALDAVGSVLPLTGPENGAALAVLSFDGPPSWRPRLLHCLLQGERKAPGYILPLAARAHLGDGSAGERLGSHLRRYPMPLDRDVPGAPIYTPVAGFVLRLLAGESERRPLP